MQQTGSDRAERLAEVERLTRSGRTAREIAERIGCSRRQVGRDRRVLGLAPPPSRRLTPDQIRRAEELLDDGAPRIEVARTLGVGETTIRRYFPDRGWTPRQIAEHSALISKGRRNRR